MTALVLMSSVTWRMHMCSLARLKSKMTAQQALGGDIGS